MLSAAESLDFEKAAYLRDQLKSLRAGKGVDPTTGKVKRSKLEGKPSSSSRRGSKGKGGVGGGGGENDKGPPGMPGTRSGKRSKKR